jgi:hypothetical protein
MGEKDSRLSEPITIQEQIVQARASAEAKWRRVAEVGGKGPGSFLDMDATIEANGLNPNPGSARMQLKTLKFFDAMCTDLLEQLGHPWQPEVKTPPETPTSQTEVV